MRIEHAMLLPEGLFYIMPLSDGMTPVSPHSP
jgi:hypothetical protein